MLFTEEQKIPQATLEMYGKRFRDRIRQSLEEYDLNGKEAALAIRSNPSSLSRMIRGMQRASEKDVIGLALFLNCRADWLLGLSDDRYDVDWQSQPDRVRLWTAYQKATESTKALVRKLLKISDMGDDAM